LRIIYVIAAIVVLGVFACVDGIAAFSNKRAARRGQEL
jgi:hypothetical protein